MKNEFITKMKNENWRTKFFAWLFVWLGAFIFVNAVTITALSKDGFTLENLSNCGSWLQGSVASLWSLAALLFIYATLLAQEKQLQHQEQQINEQKAESARQQKSMELQKFESSFFSMLDLHNGIVSQMEDRNEFVIVGRGCFKRWKKRFSDNYQELLAHKNIIARTFPSNQGAIVETIEEKYNIVMKEYDKFFANTSEQLGHYYRTLYHIIKLVSDSLALKDEVERKRYVSILRAQLSAYELGLLYYNCLLPDYVAFRKFAVRYDLFEHLEDCALLNREHREFMELVLKRDSAASDP